MDWLYEWLYGLGDLNFTQQFFIGVIIALLVGTMLRMSGGHGGDPPKRV